MKKTSKYATKLKQRGYGYNGAAWANVIQRCRPYTDEDVVPGWHVGSTQGAATDCVLRARIAFDDIREGRGTVVSHDMLAHSLGVAWLRAIEIEGEDGEGMIPIIKAATFAVKRMSERHTRTGRFGWDGPALQEVDAGLDVYEAIVQASSPAQMTAACDKRLLILKAQGLIRH